MSGILFAWKRDPCLKHCLVGLQIVAIRQSGYDITIQHILLKHGYFTRHQTRLVSL